jgi:hypothetical protein
MLLRLSALLRSARNYARDKRLHGVLRKCWRQYFNAAAFCLRKITLSNVYLPRTVRAHSRGAFSVLYSCQGAIKLHAQCAYH